MRVAVVDLGTNTCRLLLAEVQAARLVHTQARLTGVVRLGEGVDRTGHLNEAAVRRTHARLGEYATLIEDYGPERRLLVATSALRDASNGVRFLTAVERDFRLPWRVIEGREEAALVFRGALSAAPPHHGRRLVVDIGGGSTELAIGQATPGAVPRPHLVESLNVGAVRLTERFLAADPPTAGQWQAAVTFTRRLLAQSVPPEARRVNAGIGVAGTITTLVAYELGLSEYRSELVHGRLLTLASMQTAIRTFRALTSAQRGLLPGIQPGREDVILAGALIAREVCRLFGLTGLRCSEADILEGAALALADEPPLAASRTAG